MSPGKLAMLGVKMLRYRVALMLWLFLLLGTARHDGLNEFRLSYVWAILALGACYVAATTINDIVDVDVDRLNHPNGRGRPLVTGEADKRELYVLHALSAALALFAAFLIGPRGLIVVALSLLISYAYSVQPLRLSYRTYLAPLMLSVAYVLIPYWLGLVAAQASFNSGDWLFAGALLALFGGRIVLKDFRDRTGDARYGKPTLLLRFGEGLTCLVSLASVLVGNLMLFVALGPDPRVAVLLELFLVAVYSMLLRLRRARLHDDEQLAIGVGAKMGNGLLITVLGLLILSSQGAPAGDQLVLTASLTVLFGTSFVALLSHPEKAVIGYRG